MALVNVELTLMGLAVTDATTNIDQISILLHHVWWVYVQFTSYENAMQGTA